MVAHWWLRPLENSSANGNTWEYSSQTGWKMKNVWTHSQLTRECHDHASWLSDFKTLKWWCCIQLHKLSPKKIPFNRFHRKLMSHRGSCLTREPGAAGKMPCFQVFWRVGLESHSLSSYQNGHMAAIWTLCGGAPTFRQIQVLYPLSDPIFHIFALPRAWVKSECLETGIYSSQNTKLDGYHGYHGDLAL